MCVGASTGALAQTVPATQLGGWSSAYPGAVYVSPQDSSFVAPGIYRSLGPAARVVSPMEITQICTRDFRETQALNKLFSRESEAAGLTDVVHKDFAAKVAGLDLKYVSLGANLEFKDEAAFSATPLHVVSADDDVAQTVLASIGASCKAIIAGHLKQGRAVFIAGKVIQAKSFSVSFSIGPKGDASVSCTIPIFCNSGTGASVSGDAQRVMTRSSVQTVTFAVVPAEVADGRRELRPTDLQ